MILDTARVALMDGTTRPAIALNPKGTVMSMINSRPVEKKIVERTIESQKDVVCLVLGNGDRLIGSRDQRVAVLRAKNVWYAPMADVTLGEWLRGEAAGLLTKVRVVGIMYWPRRELRLVGLTVEQNGSFVAEGVLCK